MSVSVNSSSDPGTGHCVIPETLWIMTSLVVMNAVLTPLLVLVLVMGYRRWRKRASAGTVTASSHTDVLTYNVVSMDLLGVFGYVVYFSGTLTKQHDLIEVGRMVFWVILPGQTMTHFLTCVERYLAAVHPITYMHLRGQRGVRIRNCTLAGVWLVSLTVMVLMKSFDLSLYAINLFLLSISSVSFCFCTVSVLWVLIRSGPGFHGGSAKRIDQSKRKAFHTMMVITGALGFRFLVGLISALIQRFSERLSHRYCVVAWVTMWFSVPSSLLLPLLFLQRAGVLPACKLKTDGSTKT